VPSRAYRDGCDLEEPIDIEVRRDELLDRLDLLAVRRVGLDEQVVDVRGDREKIETIKQLVAANLDVDRLLEVAAVAVPA
jgi:hypothetical protein